MSLGCLTILKNLSPLAVYIVACIKGIEKPAWTNLIVICVICTGVSFTVSDVQASLFGVVVLLGAVGNGLNLYFQSSSRNDFVNLLFSFPHGQCFVF